MKKALLIVIAALVFLAALIFTIYPLISDYINSKYQSEIQTAYADEVAAMDDAEIAAAWEAARDYNDSLLPVRYTQDALSNAKVEYEKQLNVDGAGIMGYVEIPKIDVYLPIYHGTGAAALEDGVGHLVGSSLPIGGAGCHAVLTGHSGVAGKRLFSDLEQLQAGDVFYLHVLGNVLAYQVEEVNTVLPDDSTRLGSIEGKDCCTLVTCTPFGVNTHRLLVQGIRIANEEAKAAEREVEHVGGQSTWMQQYYRSLGIGVAAVTLIGAVALILWRIKRRKHDKG